MEKKPFKINQSGGGNKRKKNFRSAGFIALLILFGMIIFSATNQPSNLKEVTFSDVIRRANSGEIKKIEIAGDQLNVTKKNEEKATDGYRRNENKEIFKRKGFEITVNPVEQNLESLQKIIHHFFPSSVWLLYTKSVH